MTDLQGAIDAINPNSTDEEWTRLLAEAMNAADEIAALRARVAAVERLYDKWVLNLEWLDGLRERSDLTEFGDGRHTYATEIVSDLRAILSKQEPEYSGWVEVVDEGGSGNDAIAAIGGGRG